MERHHEQLIRRYLQTPDPSPAALRLAATLAERLDAVVPRPFRVRAGLRGVSVYRGDVPEGGSDVAGVLDHQPGPPDPDDEDAEEEAEREPEPFAQRVAHVAWNVLNGVQDVIVRVTARQWPTLPQGGMALPGTRADATRLYLWYGPDEDGEDGAVLSLPPIALDELAEPPPPRSTPDRTRP